MTTMPDSSAIEAYFPYFTGIHGAANMDELVSCFDALVKAVGMELFCLYELESVGTNWRKQLVIGTFSATFLEAFWRDRRTFDSSIIRYTKIHGQPFTAGDVVSDYEKLTPKERKSLEKAAKSGMTDGIVFPLKGRVDRVAGVTLTGDTKLLDADLIWVLSCLSVGLYQRACALDNRPKPEFNHNSTGFLTERERECLTWVAIGKTDKQVADTLGITERTVKFHIINAKTKLNAKTRLQAVITALNNVEILI